MKEVYKAVSDIFLGDTDLIGMTNYTDAKMNIRRGFVPAGQWDTLVVYYTQAEIVMTDFTSQIRIVPLIVRVFDRKDDLLCDTIAERIILLLDGSDLDVEGQTFVYDVAYEGELISTSWNNDLKAYEKTLRFKMIVRVDGIVGSSGMPVRKRKT